MMPLQAVDAFYMKQALLEARKAEDAGEVPVGAVFVWRHQPIARAGNRVERDRDATAHAEMLCLREAQKRCGRRLGEGTLYVNLEPCPMCAGAIIQARVGRLVYAMKDPERGGCGGCCDVLHAPGQLWKTRSTEGIYAATAKKQLRAFFQRRRAQRNGQKKDAAMRG